LLVTLRALLFSAFIAAAPYVLPHYALAQAPKAASQTASPQPAQIDRNGVLILIRSTVLALDQANKTGNYTVLRDLGAPGFQANNAARLAEIFASQRRDNLDLSGVAVIDPQLTVLPQIEANGMMRMAGFFPSVPQQVNFEMLFAAVSGQWRLFGLSVNIGQSGPVAPRPPDAATPALPATTTTTPAPAPPAAPPQHGKPAASAGKPAAKPGPPPHTEIKKEQDKPSE
jgi:hypothetical protein